MHKVKRAIAELRDYLGQDREGIRLLDRIANIANGIRKESAAERERAEREQSSAVSARAEVSLLQQRVHKLERDLEQVRANSQQYRKDAQRLRKEKEDSDARIQSFFDKFDFETPHAFGSPAPQFVGASSKRTVEELSPLVQDLSRFTESFNAMRRRIPICPPHHNAPHGALRPMYFRLEDIVDDYSVDAMATLGRFVATLALCNIPGHIFAEYTFSGARLNGRIHDEKALSKFIYWFRKKLDTEYRQLALHAADALLGRR